MMRILYYHQHFSTPDGATGIRSYQFARRLIEAGHQVTLVCGSFGVGRTGLDGEFKSGVRDGEVDGIHVVEFALKYSNRDAFLSRSLTFLKYAWRSMFYALRADYDLVFATSTPLTAAIPGIAAKIFRRKPFVFEVRDLWPDLPREMGVITNPIVLMAMSVLEWAAYRAADGHIGLAPGITEGILRRLPVDSDVQTIPNGCDLDFFGQGPSKRPEGVGDDDLAVIFAGSQGLANGVDMALDAAAVLKKRGRNDIKLVIVGDGMLNEHLRQRVRDEQLANCIFLKLVPKTELVEILNGCDVGLQILANFRCFYYGTSPNKFFDYIASGLPVLNNYPGWLADMIEENKCGIAIPPQDPEAFADALEQFADDRVRTRAMGENAGRLAARDFDRGVLSGQFVDYIERVYSRCCGPA